MVKARTELVRAESARVVERVVHVLRAGGLVAFPTDTVYGLAALPTDRQAVQQIYAVKGRNVSQPIALLLSDARYLESVALFSPAVRPLVEQFWPGALTLVLTKTAAVSVDVSTGPTVGVRVPDLPLARKLIRAAGGVLAVTSANRTGEPPALTAAEVLEKLGGLIDLIVEGGACTGGVPSTVLDCTRWPPVILRPGAISEADIEAALQLNEK